MFYMLLFVSSMEKSSLFCIAAASQLPALNLNPILYMKHMHTHLCSILIGVLHVFTQLATIVAVLQMFIEKLREKKDEILLKIVSF